MKKNINTLMLAAALMASATALTSCDKDNNGTTPTPPATEESLYVIPAVDGEPLTSSPPPRSTVAACRP